MKKAFICALQNFPRGSAGANYIQYLALALKECGYYPIVISKGNYRACSFEVDTQSYKYQGIELYIPFRAKSKILGYLENHFLVGYRFLCALKKYQANSEDIIITYLAGNKKASYAILNYTKKKHIVSAACIAEWFPRESFASEKKYNDYRITIQEIIPKFDIVFPISSYIASMYTNEKCVVRLLPIMTNTNEYCYYRKDDKRKIRFIFPANGKMKDAIKEMLISVGKIAIDRGGSFEFHITNYNKEKVEEKIQDLDKDIQISIIQTVICHSWVEYDELVEMYRNTDFLLLARDVSQITKANFPSKVPEVMTYGVIPVVSRVGDYTALYLQDGYDSIIFDGCSVEACSEAIKRALDISSEKRIEMSNNARRTATERFDYHNWCKYIVDSFIEVKENERFLSDF